MKLRLPDSVHLQNIEGLIRNYSPHGTPTRLRVSGNSRYIHARPFALAMAACAGALAKNKGWTTTGSIPKVASLPY
ncbi:MAG: hypothetical protein ACYCV6_18965 [Steroidobacteraceae bacterium]